VIVLGNKAQKRRRHGNAIACAKTVLEIKELPKLPNESVIAIRRTGGVSEEAKRAGGNREMDVKKKKKRGCAWNLWMFLGVPRTGCKRRKRDRKKGKDKRATWATDHPQSVKRLAAKWFRYIGIAPVQMCLGAHDATKGKVGHKI